VRENRDGSYERDWMAEMYASLRLSGVWANPEVRFEPQEFIVMFRSLFFRARRGVCQRAQLRKSAILHETLRSNVTVFTTTAIIPSQMNTLHQRHVIGVCSSHRLVHLRSNLGHLIKKDMLKMIEAPDLDTSQSSALMKRLPIIVITVVAVLGAYFLRDYLTFEALAENRESLIAFRDVNYLLTVLVFIAIYTVVVAFSLPGAIILTLAGGFLFATFPGFLYNVIAATTGATGIFIAARWGFGKQLGAKLEGSAGIAKKIKDGINKNQWSMLFLIRLVPVVPFFVANLIPAFLEVPLRRFVISTFFGIIPGSVVYTSVGAGLGEVFAKGETPNLGIIFELHILFPIVGLCVLAAIPIIIKSVRGNKGL
jgi:uncharacterized membrane protein YdjX (TVP38/TMEM64 family)